MEWNRQTQDDVPVEHADELPGPIPGLELSRDGLPRGVVEEGDVRDIFARPRMPYTRALMNSIPRLDRSSGVRKRLESIPVEDWHRVAAEDPAAAARELLARLAAAHPDLGDDV